MSTDSFPSRAQLTIPNDWQVMMAQTEEGPMVLKVNSGYANLIGHPDYPYQVGVTIPLNSPTGAGMHDSDEGDQVVVIEELLVEALQNENLALWVFSQCSVGVKEWVFYTTDPAEAAKRINEVRDQVKTHPIEDICLEDPEWDIFQAFTGITAESDDGQADEYSPRSQLTIPDDWQVKMTQTEEGPMELKVNSGYANLIGHPDYPYQVGVAVPLNSPTEEGMYGSEEGDQLVVIEELLVEALQNENLALWVFSQCSLGVKEWVFYTTDPDEVLNRINEVRDQVKTHAIQHVFQVDPEWRIFQGFTGITAAVKDGRSDEYPHLLVATLHECIEPLDRGERYEDPLGELLAEGGLGKVTGGGSQLDDSFKVKSVDIEIVVADLDSGIPLVLSLLEEKGAPQGSELFFERDGVEHRIEFGQMEGISLVLDASLPNELWGEYAGEVWPTLNEILQSSGAGSVHGTRSGSDSEEVFIYGPSAQRIIDAIADFRASFPLCKNSKVVEIRK
jgi:hypothetical protein